MDYSFSRHLPEIKAWNNGAGIDVKSWITAIGRYDHLLGYSTLLWPHFSIYDECVFRDYPQPEVYMECFQQLKGDKTAIEKLLNHIHIADMFAASTFPLTKPIALAIGDILKETWTCKLRTNFPERKIIVEFLGNDTDDLLDYEVTFSQIR